VAQLAAELTPLASARHFLGAELRHWRCLRGMSLATLGRAVHVTGSLLGKVEKADRWPGTDLIRRCDVALDSAGVLYRLYELAEHERRGLTSPANGHQSASATSPFVAVIYMSDAAQRWPEAVRQPAATAARQRIGSRDDQETADVIEMAAIRNRSVAQIAATSLKGPWLSSPTDDAVKAEPDPEPRPARHCVRTTTAGHYRPTAATTSSFHAPL
jgi:hypothetical protein